MLRITREGEPVETLVLEGSLAGAWVGEVADLCARLGAGPVRFRLDVSAVGFADEAGAALLRALRQQGVVLGGCSGFLLELLGDAAEVEDGGAA
jgi:hypothetical protein